MFFKAIALLIAAIVGYYLFDTGSEQGAIFLALPVSAIAAATASRGTCAERHDRWNVSRRA